jgi:hypothetical protein
MDRALRQNEVGDSDPMMRVDIPGEGGERAVGHADAHGRRMLERIRQTEAVSS